MRRLVHHDNPEGKVTPTLLLADLRHLDPTFEIVYVGDRMWWVGAVSPNEVREEKGRLILAQMDQLDDYMKDRPTIARNIMLGKLLIQGFSRIEMYRAITGDPSGLVEVAWFDGNGTEEKWYQTTILADMKERQWCYEHDGGEAAVAARMRLTDGTEKKEQSDADFREYLANDGRAHYRREVRGRVQMGYGGMTGGPGKLVTL